MVLLSDAGANDLGKRHAFLVQRVSAAAKMLLPLLLQRAIIQRNLSRACWNTWLGKQIYVSHYGHWLTDGVERNSNQTAANRDVPARPHEQPQHFTSPSWLCRPKGKGN